MALASTLQNSSGMLRRCRDAHGLIDLFLDDVKNGLREVGVVPQPSCK